MTTLMMMATTGPHQELGAIGAGAGGEGEEEAAILWTEGTGGSRGEKPYEVDGSGDSDAARQQRHVRHEEEGASASEADHASVLGRPGSSTPTAETTLSLSSEVGGGRCCQPVRPGRPYLSPKNRQAPSTPPSSRNAGDSQTYPASAHSPEPMPRRQDDDEGLSPSLSSFHEDILENVVEFLDLDSISTWSETNRRLNRACQAFLHRQLQLKPPSASSQGQGEAFDDNDLSSSCLSSPVPTLEHVHQLCRMDNPAADLVIREELVQRKDDGRHYHHGLPFDDELFGAYRGEFAAALPVRLHDAATRLRAAWLEYTQSGEGHESTERPDMTQKKMAAAAAAMLGTVACVAVASSCYHEPGGAASAAQMASSCHLPSLELVEEMVTRLFKLGVMGTLMKGGAKAAAGAARARTKVMPARGSATPGGSPTNIDSDHTTMESDADKGTLGIPDDEVAGSPTPLDSHKPRSETAMKVPCYSDPDANLTVRGCAGAYRRVLARCRDALRAKVKQTRKERFLTLASLDERQEIASRFMEACSHDDVSAVQRLIHEMDVEGFYVSNDGTTTCGLHSAAFHNSCRVVEYLVTSGCCGVNLSDANGWTALHFAAGASALEATQLLLRHGANDAQEAANGYTPLQWAERLQNASVLPVLRKARDDRRQRWRRTHLHLSPFFILLGEGFFDAVPHLLEMVAQSTILPARAQ